MHILHVHLKVKPERIGDFIDATIQNATSSLQEPGCVRFDVIQDAADHRRSVLYFYEARN